MSSISGAVACPRCQTRITVLPGWDPACANCGYQPARTGTFADDVQPLALSTSTAVKRPGEVTFVAVMEFISGGLGLLALLFLVAFKDTLSALGSAAQQSGNSLNNALLLLAAISVACLIVGRALLKGHKWPRIPVMLQAGYAGYVTVQSLVNAQQAPLFVQIIHWMALALYAFMLGAMSTDDARSFLRTKLSDDQRS